MRVIDSGVKNEHGPLILVEFATTSYAGPHTSTEMTRTGFDFALGAGLPTPPGSDRDCRGNAMGETCGRAFRRDQETRSTPMRLHAMRCKD